MRDSLEKIALITAIPADLLAIIPAILKFFSYAKGEPSQNFEAFSIKAIGITFPLESIIIVAIFYAFSATFGLSSNRLREDRSRDSARLVSLSITLFLALPISASLTVFGHIAPSEGLAICILSISLAFFLGFGWKGSYRGWKLYDYEDFGLRFLLVVPIVWLCLQSDTSSNGITNLGWALLYTTASYLLAVLIVFICDIFSSYFLDVKISFLGYIISAILFLIAYSVFARVVISVATFWWTVILITLVIFFLGVYTLTKP